jgi:predicted dehydrogenase
MPSHNDRPLRAVVAGAGFLGRFWARELVASADTELVGWVDLEAERAAAAAAELGVEDVATGAWLAAMLEAQAPDFLVNATVPQAHHEVTLTALEHGAAVLSEKPLAATMDQARELVAAADRAQRLFAVSQNRRYMPELRTYRDRVARLGALASVTCDFFKPLSMEPGHYLHALDEPLLLDMAIHLFDAARLIAGADPVSVYCESFRPSWSAFAGATAAHAIFEMTGGVRFAVNANWSAEGFETSWTGSWRAVGEHGTAIWDGETTDPFPDRFLGLETALAEFVAGLRNGTTPQRECHDNVLSLAMCHAAAESARVGARVPVASELLSPRSP